MPTNDLQISREQAAQLAHETVAILRSGSYHAANGAKVDISVPLQLAIDGTVEYLPGMVPPTGCSEQYATDIRVVNTTTLDAARPLAMAGVDAVVLNFASAKSPGGGFLRGDLAQEEYLCRSSGLYACLEGQPMYNFHRTRPGALYTDYALYSPQVPVIRDDRGTLLDAPWQVSVITSAAVNARWLTEDERSQVEPAMRSRVEKVLALGLTHGHAAIVLGAWGCGAFRNDADMVAGLFADALQGAFRGAYREVVFAITDWSAERRFIAPFERRFGAASD